MVEERLPTRRHPIADAEPTTAYQQHTPFTMADANANANANLYNYDAISVRRFKEASEASRAVSR
jgi:hypothetical protein